MMTRTGLIVVLVCGCATYEDENLVAPSEAPAAVEHSEPVYALADPAEEPEEPEEPEEGEAEPEGDACARGKAAARADAKRGAMTLDAWGYPASWAWEYWKLLEKHYGVRTRHHGCVVSPEPDDVIEARRCYSREVERIVKRKHGADAFEKMLRRAQKRSR